MANKSDAEADALWPVRTYTRNGRITQISGVAILESDNPDSTMLVILSDPPQTDSVGFQEGEADMIIISKTAKPHVIYHQKSGFTKVGGDVGDMVRLHACPDGTWHFEKPGDFGDSEDY